MKYITTIGEKEFLVEVIDERHGAINGETCLIDFETVSDQPVYSLLINGQSYEAYVYQSDEGWQVLLHGTLYPAGGEDARAQRLRADSSGGVGGGTRVRPSDSVEQKQTLLSVV